MAVEQTLANRRVLLVIGGGIAAYKVLDLVRRLRERGGVVRAVMTEAAKAFVTPLSVASLTGERVYDDLFSLTDEAEMGHIELSRAADLLVVAPATANLMAKMAQGIADDLASTLLLATDKRVLLAPSMNVRMWLHPATQRNLARLRTTASLRSGRRRASWPAASMAQAAWPNRSTSWQPSRQHWRPGPSFRCRKCR